jgi:hypothetical protein
MVKSEAVPHDKGVSAPPEAGRKYSSSGTGRIHSMMNTELVATAYAHKAFAAVVSQKTKAPRHVR